MVRMWTEADVRITQDDAWPSCQLYVTTQSSYNTMM